MINPNPIINGMGGLASSQNTSGLQSLRTDADNNNFIGKLIRRKGVVGIGASSVAPSTVRSLKQDKI